MTLFHLCPVDEDAFRSSNMEVHLRFLINAESEERARELASRESGFTFWTNKDVTLCTPLTGDEKEGTLFSEKKTGYNKSLSKIS